jgi:hypothetical protein
MPLTEANTTYGREQQVQSYYQLLRSSSADLQKQSREALARAREALAHSRSAAWPARGPHPSAKPEGQRDEAAVQLR